MAAEDHQIEVKLIRTRYPSVVYYRAECSCGQYRSRRYEWPGTARSAGNAHRRTIRSQQEGKRP